MNSIILIQYEKISLFHSPLSFSFTGAYSEQKIKKCHFPYW